MHVLNSWGFRQLTYDLGPEPVKSQITGPPDRGGMYHCVVCLKCVLTLLCHQVLAVHGKVFQASLCVWAKASDV